MVVRMGFLTKQRRNPCCQTAGQHTADLPCHFNNMQANNSIDAQTLGPTPLGQAGSLRPHFLSGFERIAFSFRSPWRFLIIFAQAMLFLLAGAAMPSVKAQLEDSYLDGYEVRDVEVTSTSLGDETYISFENRLLANVQPGDAVGNAAGSMASQSGKLTIRNLGAANLRDGLLLHLPLDGDVRDYSGHGRDGVVGESVWVADRSGKADSAFEIVPNSPISIAGLDPDDYPSDFSYGCWVRSINGQGVALGWEHDGSWGATGFVLNLPSDLEWAMGSGSPNTRYQVSLSAPLNQWHHFFATHDSQWNRLYLNGELIREAPSLPFLNNISTLKLGYFGMAGALDEVLVYERALSSAEVAQVFAQGLNATTPSIVTPPMDQNKTVGESVRFNVEAAGTPPLVYQWRKGGAPLSNGGNISGADTAALTLAIAQAGDAGNYDVVVSNAAGRVTSAAAALTVEVLTAPEKIIGIVATATSELTSHNRLAAHSVDGIYCDSNFWETSGIGFSGVDDRDPAITFDMGSVRSLNHFIIWNSHEFDPAIKRMIVETSVDGLSFTALGERHLEPGNGCPPIPQTVSLEGVRARYVRLDFLENWNGVVFPVTGNPTGWPFIAIDEIEFFGGGGLPGGPPLPLQDLRAFEKFPAVFLIKPPEEGMISYQWQKDGAPLTDDDRISGARSHILRIDNAEPGDAGYYHLEAAGTSGRYRTELAELRVRKLPPPGERTNFSTVHVFGDAFAHTPHRLEASISAGSGLIEGSDGLLYGTTRGGGTNREGGVLYRISKEGSGFQILHHYGELDSEGRSEIIEASNGVLFGTTYRGGTFELGYIYRMNRDGSDFSILHHFGSVPGDGLRGTSPLVEGPDGMLYGVTGAGGAHAEGIIFTLGTIYRIGKDGTGYSVVKSFGATPDSPRYPYGLLLASDGAFYGATGRAEHTFKYTLDGTLSGIPKGFVSPVPGSQPFMEGADGYFYASHHQGQSISRFAKDGTSESLLASFPFQTYLAGEVIQARDGSFLAPSGGGGPHRGGGALVILPDSTYSLLHGFNPLTQPGAYPTTRLLEASDGALYGVSGIVDKTEENGGHAMIYRLRWSEDSAVTIKRPVRTPADGWIIPFEAEETGSYTLHRATDLEGPWTPVQSRSIRAWQGTFEQGAGSEASVFFRIRKDEAARTP